MDNVVLSVSDFIALTNQTLEYAYPQVTIEGEVSQFKVNRGKYVFFDIKDEQGSVGCFMMLFSLKIALEDGMKVRIVARPKLTDWGKFSLTVQHIQPVGEGALRKSFELLKAKLTKEGLFAAERKRSLPEIPCRIGIVSSMQAAGYQDFITIAGERWRGISFDVTDVRVQGVQSESQIVAALEHFNQSSTVYDAIAVIRGGGSLDDLQSFNTESVARAIAGSRFPVVVGVGHEQDTTLADLAADVRAATPSNAAQILLPDAHEFKIRIGYDITQASEAVGSMVRMLRENLSRDLRDAADAATHAIARYRLTIDSMWSQIKLINPQNILDRGYSIVTDANGALVRSKKSIKTGDELMVQLSDGTVKTKAT